MAKLTFEDLAHDIARAQDDALADGAAVAEARARLLGSSAVGGAGAAKSATPPVDMLAARRRAARRRAGVVLAVAAALAACWLVMVRRPASLTLAVGPSQQASANIGAWLAAPASAELPLAFSDGTRLVLAPGGRARIARVDADGADLVLERGRGHANVVHRDTSRWTVIAGPFEVHVTGTEFNVGWDPATEELDVTLERGGVTITGCAVDRRVVVGESIRAICKDAHAEVRTVASVVSTTPVVIGETDAAPPSEPSTTTALPPPSVPLRAAASEGIPPGSDRDASAAAIATTASVAAPAWRELAMAGKYKEATDLALAADFARECENATPEDLLLLADAARFAGHMDRANEALVALRRRFPSDARASVAAFQLGRLAFDQAHAYAKATEWFETYLREAPAGPLAREASGRLIEAKARAGDAAGARRAAQRYLDVYPTGPHADIAHALVAGSAADASPRP
jgi:ferric-dicitrate binding protein FerR (iron transport regulator)/TolA-binding protein